MITLFLLVLVLVLVFVVWPMAGFIWMLLDAINPTSRRWTKSKTIDRGITFMFRVYMNIVNRLDKR